MHISSRSGNKVKFTFPKSPQNVISLKVVLNRDKFIISKGAGIYILSKQRLLVDTVASRDSLDQWKHVPPIYRLTGYINVHFQSFNPSKGQQHLQTYL